MSTGQNQAITKRKYRPEIDGLRAFAVIAVIINHFNKDILPGGYLGVDIFFVISGYVITSSLYERPSKDFKDFISGFYERRIKRLVPALSVFVLITSILICLFNPEPGTSLRTGLTSLFGLSNIYLFWQSTDYFAQSTDLNVFTHTWSLGVEEQFYILFPFLIWFSGFGRQTKNGARNLFLVVGALTVASLIGFLYLYPTNQPAAYFLMPSRFWEMAAGCLIFIGFKKRASIEQFLEKMPPLLVMALIVGAMYLPMSLATYSTIGVVVLSSILIACLKKQTTAFKVFTHPKVVYIGLISYSLYLWHWGVLSVSRWTIGIHWWSVPFQVCAMLGLAVISYKWIETPFRSRFTRNLPRWLVSSAGVSLLVITFISSYMVSRSHMRIFAGDKVNARNLLVSNYQIEGTPLNWKNCTNFTKQQEKCSWEETDSPDHFFLVGDSHAGHLMPMLGSIKMNMGGSFFAAIAGGQLFPDEADDWRLERLREALNNSDSPNKYIIIANDWSRYDDKRFTNSYISSWKSLISLSKMHNARIILINQQPVFEGKSFYATACSNEFYRPFPPRKCPMNLKYDQNEFKKGFYFSSKILDKFERSNLKVFNPHSMLCIDGSSPSLPSNCRTTNNGEMLFIDGSHLSSIGAKSLAEGFIAFIGGLSEK